MFRKVLAGALSTIVFASPVFAENQGVRVLSFSQGKGDATGEAITKTLQKALVDKGYGKPGEMPEPAVLAELKSRSLVEGESLDELKGFPLGADYLVSGSYNVKDDQLTLSARLIQLDSGEVIASTTESGPKGDTEALAKTVADKLTSNLAAPAADKVERVDVEARGQAPGNLPGSAARTVALADAKRNAIEEAVGAVVDVTKVPDMKQVKASAQSMLRYRVLSEGKEGGKYVVRIAANVDIPADLAAKYPAPSKAIADETGYKAYVERSPKGEVNWQNGVLRVVGRAKAADEADAKASLLARRAAVADAYARAVEVVSGVRLDSDTKVSDAEKKDKDLRSRIQGLVQGGKVVSETAKSAAGNYEVTMEVPMRGLRGIQTIFLDRLVEPKSLKETAQADAEAESEFTGIIIDARGTGMQAGMFPKILDEAGNVVADPSATDKDILRDKGQAAFVIGDAGAGDQGWLLERLGPNPVMFKAEMDGSYQVAGLAPILISQAAPKLPKGFKMGMRRQGPKPLTIKGLSVNGPTKVNLLVSTNVKDKAKFQQNLAKAFGKCKVVVVMDSQIGGTEGHLLKQPSVLQLSWR